MNKFHGIMIGILIAGMLLCTVYMPELFGIDGITLKAAMLLGVFLIATEGLFRYIHKFFGGLGTISGGVRRRKEEKKRRIREERKARVIARRRQQEMEEEGDFYDDI